MREKVMTYLEIKFQVQMSVTLVSAVFLVIYKLGVEGKQGRSCGLYPLSNFHVLFYSKQKGFLILLKGHFAISRSGFFPHILHFLPTPVLLASKYKTANELVVFFCTTNIPKSQLVSIYSSHILHLLLQLLHLWARSMSFVSLWITTPASSNTLNTMLDYHTVEECV